MALAVARRRRKPRSRGQRRASGRWPRPRAASPRATGTAASHALDRRARRASARHPRAPGRAPHRLLSRRRAQPAQPRLARAAALVAVDARATRTCSACTRSGSRSATSIPRPRTTGRRALELAPEDCWAVHAVTHVMEMQGRIDEGIAFLEERRGDWAAPDNGFAFHNWWHLALFHLDRGDYARALAIYDELLAEAHAVALSPRRRDRAAVAPAARGRGRRRALRDGRRRVGRGSSTARAASTPSTISTRRSRSPRPGATTRSSALRAALEQAAWEQRANGEMTRVVGIDASEGGDRVRRRPTTRDAVEKLARGARRRVALRRQPRAARRPHAHADRGGASRSRPARARAALRAASAWSHKPRAPWGAAPRGARGAPSERAAWRGVRAAIVAAGDCARRDRALGRRSRRSRCSSPRCRPSCSPGSRC